MKFVLPLILAFSAQLHAQSLNVGVLGAADPLSLSDVQASLSADARIGSVTLYDVTVLTPGLATLQSHDAVLVFATFPEVFADPNTLGDNLAAYVAGGGGVVESLRSGMFGRLLGGNWATNYQLSTTTVGTTPFNTYSLGNLYQPNHPIFAGVTTVGTGPSGWHSTGLAASAVVLAEWSDGAPMVAEHPSASNVVYVNARPISTNASTQGLDTATDALLMLANCVEYVAPALPTGPALSSTGSPGGTMTFDLSGFTPNGRAALVYGPASSYVVAVGGCAGLQLGLSPLNFPPTSALIVLTADGAGDAQLVMGVPGNASGLSVQGVDASTCSASNLITL